MKLIESFESLINNEKYSELNTIIQTKFPKYYSTELMEDIFDWVEKSGVKSIKFERIKVGGMAHYNRLILSDLSTSRGFCFFLYLLLHETSHYYQFKKHGMDIELDLYKSEDINEIADNLLKIEMIADRLAIMKFKSLVSKYKFNCYSPVSVYGTLKSNTPLYNEFLDYIKEIKKEVVEKNITSHTEIADLIFNYIKI